MGKLIKGVNDLETMRPDLEKEWHTTKNGNLKPSDVTCGSNKKVWWNCNKGHEWQAIVNNRTKGARCPICFNQKVLPGFNDLATKNPELAKQWHPTKNGSLNPTNVTAGSTKKVWWLFSYDDPVTGKHFDFEWKAMIASRNNGNNCPYLNGRILYSGFNDLATKNSELAKQWHPTKNGNLKPCDITFRSSKKVWWLLPYDDPNTGKHFDFEWKSSVDSRYRGDKCPYLSGRAICIGFNDLATVNPKLAVEWHPTKNGKLKPTDVTSKSKRKVWWLLPYDDPNTGKHFDFEWKSTIDSRYRGDDCPYLSGRDIHIGFNDLATVNPKLAAEWHPTKNGKLKPTDVTINSTKKVWWLFPYDDTITGKHFDFEWKATIGNRARGNGCPYLSGKQVYPGFNDLATKNPELAKQWHPTKNGNLRPTDVTSNSRKEAWWILSYDDVKTGEHFNFEWKTPISTRNKGYGCPYIASSKTERLLYLFLKDKNIKFIPEKKYKNCKDKQTLPFDIYIKENDVLIELDGIQHFKNIEYFGGNKLFKIQKRHDNIKNKFCLEKNIPLLRIPYIYDSEVDKAKIKELVSNFIETKKVPQEILDFYAKYKFSNYVKCVKELEEKLNIEDYEDIA